MSTLDQLFGGRIGWNIVTSANEREPSAISACRANSHTRAVNAWAQNTSKSPTSCWEGSWDVRPIVNDPSKGVYTDPTKVHDINHQGQRGTASRGFNLMEPPHKRTPLLAQAGGSPAGLDFASRHAELMFLSAFSLETIAAQVGTVRELARITRTARRRHPVPAGHDVRPSGRPTKRPTASGAELDSGAAPRHRRPTSPA